jgi:phage tail-like protein
MPGWLAAQLPEAMQRQDVLAAFARTGEEIANSIRFQLAALDAQLDPATATDPMLEFVAEWFGFTFDARTDAEMLGRLLAEVGPIIRTRGTRDSLASLLRVLSGGEVSVDDPGAIVGPTDTLPAANPTVVAHLATAGSLGVERLRAVAGRELPVGVELQLVVGTRDDH